jgi:hypothetical protein
MDLFTPVTTVEQLRRSAYPSHYHLAGSGTRVAN